MQYGLKLVLQSSFSFILFCFAISKKGTVLVISSYSPLKMSDSHPYTLNLKCGRNCRFSSLKFTLVPYYREATIEITNFKREIIDVSLLLDLQTMNGTLVNRTCQSVNKKSFSTVRFTDIGSNDLGSNA